jgi:hypothetical protein
MDGGQQPGRRLSLLGSGATEEAEEEDPKTTVLRQSNNSTFPYVGNPSVRVRGPYTSN